MKQGEICERTTEELLNRIGDLEIENESLGEEVSQWMRDYDELWKEKEELNDKLIEKDAREARDTEVLLDILHAIENMLSLPGHVYTDAQLLNIRDGIKAHLKE